MEGVNSCTIACKLITFYWLHKINYQLVICNFRLFLYIGPYLNVCYIYLYWPASGLNGLFWQRVDQMIDPAKSWHILRLNVNVCATHRSQIIWNYYGHIWSWKCLCCGRFCLNNLPHICCFTLTKIRHANSVYASSVYPHDTSNMPHLSSIFVKGDNAWLGSFIMTFSGLWCEGHSFPYVDTQTTNWFRFR